MSKLTKFSSALDEDLAWRKKEVSSLLLLANHSNELIIVKSAILLIYAHWEGYIKNASKLYLKYVSDKKINLHELSVNFEAIQIKGTIQALDKSSCTLNLSNEIDFLKLIYGEKNKVFNAKIDIRNDKDKSIINTKDNLTLDVLYSILKIVGIEGKDCLKTKDVYINTKLLNNRNKIAHGNKIDSFNDDFDIKIDDAKELRDLIFIIMDAIKDDLIYHAENELYLYKNNNLCNIYNNESNDELSNLLK